MSTRGIYGFYKNGVDKLTYNHFDSYPEGLGVDIIRFIQNTSIEELNDIFNKIIMVDEDNNPTDEQIRECNQYADLNVSNKDITNWYCLLRKTQGDLECYKNGLRYMIDNKNFIKDSLFCEWGYIINLDDNILEVYEGFQTEPQDNRYKTDKSLDYAKKYYNCALIKRIPLKDIYMFGSACFVGYNCGF